MALAMIFADELPFVSFDLNSLKPLKLKFSKIRYRIPAFIPIQETLKVPAPLEKLKPPLNSNLFLRKG